MFINSSINNLIDLLKYAVGNYSNRNAFCCHGTNMSYKDFYNNANYLACYLKYELKIKKGDRVAIMMPNLLQYPVAIFGILLAGGVIVNLNPMDKAPALKRELEKSGAKAIIVLEHFVAEINKLLDKKTKNLQIIITKIGDFYPVLKAVIYNFVTKFVKHQVPRYKPSKYLLANKIDFKKCINLGDILYKKLDKKINIKINSDDLAFLQFTGGTTGDPKAVMLTHANIISNLDQCYDWVKEVFTHEQELVVTPLPIYHIFALVANLLLFIKLGGLNVLIPSPRDLKDFIKSIKDIKFNVISGVNTLYKLLLNDKKFSKVDFSNLTLAIAGGMRLEKDIADKWHKVTSVHLTQGYGLTETSPVISICPVNEKFNGSAGKILKDTKIKVLAKKNENAGEILIKGPQVMKGYWQNKQATAQVLDKSGWLKTGDYGYIDKNGYLFILDRLKDIIIVSGFNVCASEVEDIILDIKGILDVAVVGVPDEGSGERVVAHVVLDKGLGVGLGNNLNHKIMRKKIMKYTHDKLAAYKTPKEVIFHDELPKNAVGKVLKRKLNIIN